MSTVKTINLKGKEYAPVSERIKQLHEEVSGSEDKTLSITTVVEVQGNLVKAQATITLYRGTFTGTSFGELGKEKALEKLETVAVGRALAFAGYLSGGEIASYDEMEKFADSGMQI